MTQFVPITTSDVVALRKESVDRNIFINYTIDNESRSLSARRAWIEIVRGPITAYPIFPSLSARRAWIEIGSSENGVVLAFVALRKESVDRNCSRSHNRLPNIPSLSARRAWIEI